MGMPSHTHSTTRPSRDRLISLMSDAGIALDKRAADRFWTYHQYLRERNEALNMTRIYEFDNMVIKLYIDSAIVGRLTTLPSPLLDIGTGPGFPGIPLAILHPEVKFLLSEGRHQRNEFLTEVVQRLGLSNVEVLGHRIAPDYDRPVQGVITRAVESMAETLQRVQRSLQPEGRVIFMKGPDCDEEIQQARRKGGSWYNLADDIDYRLLETEHLRRLVIFTRTAVPAPKPIEAPVISSSDNARFRLWKTLLTPKGIRKEGLALAGGKSALEILRFEPDSVQSVIAREGMQSIPEAIGFPTTVLEKSLFNILDVSGANMPLVLVSAPEITPLGESLNDIPERCLFLALPDPEELGQALRAAHYFGWKDVVLTTESANPFHARTLQTAGATALRLRYRRGPAVAQLPPSLKGAWHLNGPAPLPDDQAVRLFIGPHGPGWPACGEQGDLALSPGALLAATLARFPS